MWHVAPGWLPCVAFVCTAKVTFGMSFSSFYICLNYVESRGKAQKEGRQGNGKEWKAKLRKDLRRKRRAATVSVCVCSGNTCGDNTCRLPHAVHEFLQFICRIRSLSRSLTHSISHSLSLSLFHSLSLYLSFFLSLKHSRAELTNLLLR